MFHQNKLYSDYNYNYNCCRVVTTWFIGMSIGTQLGF